MSGNSWDQLPAPAHGDTTDTTVFVAVGRSLTSWEMVETRLSWLFSSLINIKGWSVPAERAYGSIATARGRIEMLRAAADAFTHGYGDKAPTEKLKALFNACQGYAGRRNEIAHGVVMPYEEAIYHDGHGEGWVLAPALYNTPKQKLASHSLTLPKYIYASAEIDHYRNGFAALVPQADKVIQEVEIVTGALKL